MSRTAALLFVCATLILAQTWESFSPPSVNDDRLLHATVYDPDNDMIYMIGGCANHNWGTINYYVYAYNPNTDTWNTSLSVMPTARAFIQGAYWDGKIYVAAGMNPYSQIISAFEVYDISVDTWTSLTPMPQSRAGHGTVAYNGNIFVIGGSNLQADGYATVYRYNIAGGTWSAATSLPQAWETGGCAIWDNVIYLCGGYNRNDTTTYDHIWSGTIDTGNPDNIVWTQIQSLPFPTGYGGATAMDGIIYILGGFDESARAGIKLFMAYHTSTGSLSQLTEYPIAITRNHMVAARRGHNQVYGVAGDANGNYSLPNNFYYKITDPLGVNETQTAQLIENTALAVYPSIGHGQFTVSFSPSNADQVSVDIYNVLGDKVLCLYEGNAPEHTTALTFSADDLPTGIYFVRAVGVGIQMTGKFVISQ